MLRNLRDLTRRIGAYQVPIYAGTAPFFIMLSVFPALMLVFSLLRFTPYTVADFAALMEDVLPGALSPLVTYLTEEVHTLNAGAVIPITAVAMLWSASRGVLGVLNGVNAIYGASETRSYLAKRLIALIYMVLFLVGIVLTLVLYVFGKKIQAMIVARIPALADATVFIMQFKYVVILLYLTLLFTLVYKVFPNTHTKFLQCLPGAVLASLGWLGFSALFTVYVDHFSNYAVVYGSLTTIVLTMVWLYFCLCILFFGGVMNQFLARPNASLRSLLPGRKKSV